MEAAGTGFQAPSRRAGAGRAPRDSSAPTVACARSLLEEAERGIGHKQQRDDPCPGMGTGSELHEPRRGRTGKQRRP